MTERGGFTPAALTGEAGAWPGFNTHGMCCSKACTAAVGVSMPGSGRFGLGPKQQMRTLEQPGRTDPIQSIPVLTKPQGGGIHIPLSKTIASLLEKKQSPPPRWGVGHSSTRMKMAHFPPIFCSIFNFLVPLRRVGHNWPFLGWGVRRQNQPVTVKQSVTRRRAMGQTPDRK